MPKAKITKRRIEALQPSDRDTILWDTELKGFGCKVTPAGRKVYFVYYRTAAGQQRRPAIGEHGRIEADQARVTAQDWLSAVAHGQDPGGDRLAWKRSETVNDLAKRYLDEYAKPQKKASSADKDESHLNNHILPLLGHLKVRDVTRADIERAKFAIMKGEKARRLDAKPRGRRIVKGGPVVANRCVALLSKMFERAEAWGLREGSPARRIEKYPETPRKRFLSEPELAELHKALAAAETAETETPAAVAAIRVLLYTGARSGEITGLLWRQVDLEAGCLRLEDSKTGDGVIALGATALEVLAGLDRRKPDDLVFESVKKGALIDLKRPWQRLRKAAGLGSDVTLHTLRHTFASWSVRGGFTLAQTGAVLRHKSAQTTMRYAHHELESQRRTADAVSSAIAGAGQAGSGAKVVPLRPGSAA